jgi:hypothetical protein
MWKSCPWITCSITAWCVEATIEQVILADGRKKLVYGICDVQLSVGRDGKMVKIEPTTEIDTHPYDASPMPSSSHVCAVDSAPTRQVIQNRVYVLDGIEVDALIGASSLESLEAYSRHQDAFFICPKTEPQYPELCRISLADRARQCVHRLTVGRESESSEGKSGQ